MILELESIADHLDHGRDELALSGLIDLSPPEPHADTSHVRDALWTRVLLHGSVPGWTLKERMEAAQLIAIPNNMAALGDEDLNRFAKLHVRGNRNALAGIIATHCLAPYLDRLHGNTLLLLLSFSTELQLTKLASLIWKTCLQRIPEFFPPLSLVSSHIGLTDHERADSLHDLQVRCRDADRQDLADLLEVYKPVLLGGNFLSMLKAAREMLTQPLLNQFAHQFGWMRLTDDDLDAAEDFFSTLENEGTSSHRYIKMWRAALSAQWPDVARLAAKPGNDGSPHELRCYASAASFAQGDFSSAKRQTDQIRNDDNTPWYIKDFAAQIAAGGRLREEGEAFHSPSALAKPGAGRPVAQSLWVTSDLPWSVRLSIQSFLANGWRYQLYVYDEPSNVPADVELLDATRILPRSAVFRESRRSGVHAGSFGAFSDLFRYALLHLRGGLWVDTDTINLKLFEPQGTRLLATESYAPGITGLNGSLIAAPAGDPLIALALERSQHLIDSQEVNFARIGPSVLADLVADFGAQRFTLLAPDVQNPVPCTQVRHFFHGPQELVSYLDDKHFANLHLFTETWRVAGLLSSSPPSSETAIGALYAGLLEADPAGLQFFDRLRSMHHG